MSGKRSKSRRQLSCAALVTEQLESRLLMARMLFQVDPAQSVMGLSAEAFNIELRSQGTNSLTARYEGAFYADVDSDSFQFLGVDTNEVVPAGEDAIGVIRAQMKNGYGPGGGAANYAGEIRERIFGVRYHAGDLAVRDLALSVTSTELPITSDNRFSTGPAQFETIDGRLDYETDFDDGSEDMTGESAPNNAGAAYLETDANGVTTLTIPVKFRFEYDPVAELTFSGKIVAISTGTKPVADLNGPAGAGFDQSLIYSVGVHASLSLAADARVTDSDSTSLASATITLNNAIDGFTSENLTVSTAGTAIVANYDTSNGVLSLSGAGTAAEYQQVIRTLSYSNIASDPTSGDRTISVLLNDGGQDGVLSNIALKVFDPNSVELSATSGVKVVVLTDADGTVTTLKLAGPGSMSLDLSGATDQTISRGKAMVTGPVAIDGITLTDTTGRSKVVISARGGDGRVSLGDVSAPSGLAAIGARNIDLAGDITIGGLVRAMTFGSVTGSTITAGAIGALTVVGAMDGSTVNATDTTPAATTLRALTVRGETTSSTVNTTGRVLKVTSYGMSDTNVLAGSVGAFTVVGNMVGSNITTSLAVERVQSLKALTVRGLMSNSVVSTQGHIAKIVTFGMTDSAIYAGRVGTEQFPDEGPDLVHDVYIGALVMKRARGTTGPLFANSVVAVCELRRASLGLVATTNNGTPFGLAIDSVASLVAQNESGQTLRLRNLEDLTTADATLAATGFAFGDFEIRVF